MLKIVIAASTQSEGDDCGRKQAKKHVRTPKVGISQIDTSVYFERKNTDVAAPDKTFTNYYDCGRSESLWMTLLKKR